MSQQRWHILEKIQVEVAAVAALAAMYFVFWPYIKPPDVDGTAVFWPLGAYGQLFTFAAVTWLIAACAAVLTTTARPQGALLATLVGAGGGCLHSQSMRLLLMRFSPPGVLLRPLIGEMACMAVIVLVASLIIRLVRLAIGQIQPSWLRPDSLAEQAVPARPPRPFTHGWQTALAMILTGHRSPDTLLLSPRGRRSIGDVITASVANLGLTLLIGLVLIWVFVFQPARGQLLFGVAISFFLAATLAAYLFPISFSGPCWIAPLLLGVFFYARSSTIGDLGPLTWTHVDCFTHILPVDWLSAGCGGAVGGYWLACRLHDTKLLGQPAKAAVAKA